MFIELVDKGLEGVFDVEQFCLDNNIDAEKVKYLYCHNNELTQLDLSKLVNLKVLYCDDNKLTELKGLDNLVNLEELYCENNKLTELDVSKLVNLRKLSCDDHELSVLDVSNLVNLKLLNGKEYILPEPEPDKLDLLINKVEKLEQIILDNKR